MSEPNETTVKLLQEELEALRHRVALLEQELEQQKQLAAAERRHAQQELSKYRTESDTLKNELITTFAHELRTPLTSILGFSEVLLTRKLPRDREQNYLTMIHEKSIQLAKIIDRLQDISRLNSDKKLKINPQAIRIGPLIEQNSPTERAVQFHNLENLPIVNVDPVRVGQVIRNIFSNAINYSSEESLIKVEGRVIPGFVEIRIVDNGIGMTPEQQTHLFEKFYRADRSNTSTGGMGLGLAISKLIIDTHGGNISIESQEGVGTAVHFTLPLGESPILEKSHQSENP